MNVNKAKKIAHRVAKIAELSSTFYAHYGSSYRLSDDSPPEAWELYRQIMAEQATIASLLDTRALENPYVRYEAWWQRRDVINPALVNELATETMLLVERAAYQAVRMDAATQTDSMYVLQEGIAGFLHPATRQKAVTNPVA